MKLLNLKPGTIVNVKVHDIISGTARVMGISSGPIVPIGRGIIVSTENLEGFDRSIYPYECMVVFEQYLTIED
jgi:hypothetical protein